MRAGHHNSSRLVAGDHHQRLVLPQPKPRGPRLACTGSGDGLERTGSPINSPKEARPDNGDPPEEGVPEQLGSSTATT
jgi:hypothetical protein